MDTDRHAAHLKYLVEELTTSGKDNLDEEKFKKIKKICKQSDIYVVELYRLVTRKLKKNHAEIRFSAFQICDEIFRRSHCFRELLLKDFLQFVDLVLGLDPKKPLPKPNAVAQKLKQKCVVVIQYWYDHFSDGYLILKQAYKYLRDCKKVDFAELTARTESERQRAEEERQKAEEIKRKKIEKIKKELEVSSQEIDDSIDQFHNCFKLLIPDLDDFFISLSNEVGSQEELVTESNNDVEGEASSDDDKKLEEKAEYGSEFMRGHGIMKGTNVKINVDDIRKVQKTEDNEVVIENLKEYISILGTRLLPSVRKWEEIIQPYSAGNESLIKTIIDYKISIQNCVKKFESLNIVHKQNQNATKAIDSSSDDDDDDFIEVPWDDPRVVSAAASEAALLGINNTSSCHLASTESSDPDNQPSSSGLSHLSSELQSARQSSWKTSKSIRFSDEYDVKGESAPKRLHNPLAGLSQVWTATADLHEQDENESTGGILGIATQRINYERTFEPVKWACRAPLKTGRLCPRRDREKCPLHGAIIPRDEAGQPLLPEDAAREEAAKKQYEQDHPAWQDPQLLAELKAATGVDLKVEKGRRKRKYENLTDIKKTTPKDRLAKKVLSKKAVRRVNAALSKDHRSGPNTSSDFRF